MQNNRVIHFEVQADDLERAKNFYEKALGWKITQIGTKEKMCMDYWGIETGEGPGINGGLYQRPEGSPRPESLGERHWFYDCTVTTTDIDKLVEAVKANGGEILRDKMEMQGVGWFARAKDTEGNVFGLMQPTDWKPK